MTEQASVPAPAAPRPLPGQITYDELCRRMGSHPASGDQPERYARNREAFIGTTWSLIDGLPPSRELSEFVTNMENALMWLNKAIASNKIGADPAAG